MSSKKLMMSKKDMDDLLKLHVGIWPGKRAYNRLKKAMDEGGFDFSEFERERNKKHNKVLKFMKKELANGSSAKKN